ncbi:MAG TPA: TrmH family RNA methyltransferase, partial [Bacteroidales bacterium]|nr:TrmH family RNA methyltransferase [Bacteroidales bacterium]
MIKYLFYIFNFIGFLILSLFQDPVSVSIQAPEEATVGTSIIVQVTINKGSVSSFARYQQNLPVGYTAEAVNLPNGDFTFKDQRIIVGWLSLPRDSQITFTYKINIDPTAEGPLFLSGIFSYIEKHIEDLVLKNINPLILVAEAPEKPGNIGALLRTADAAGVDAFIIANPNTDIFNPNIIRS